MTTVATFSTRYQAEHAAGFLRNNRVDAIIWSDDAGGLNPAIGFIESFEVRVRDEDEELARELEPRILAVPGVFALRENEEPAPSELGLVIDRDRATVSGASPEVIAGIIGYALRGTPLPRFNYEGREIPVRVRFQESDRDSLAALGAFQVPTVSGGSIPLSAVTTPQYLSAPKGIFRSNKRIARNITVELRPEEAKAARERLLALQRQVALPEGVTFGTAQFQVVNEELGNMIFAGTLSIAFIYLLMGFLFESFILPLSIITTIPLAGIGVVWIHVAAGKDLDFLGAVGAILLIGVVVNNAIVLIDYVLRLRAAGHPRREALLLAADRRFRPIAMTALTTIIGMIPLTLQQPSDIGLSYKSFGLALIGGMCTATLLTLLVVPVFYTLFDDARLAAQRALGGVFTPRPPSTTTESDPGNPATGTDPGVSAAKEALRG